MPVRRDPPRRLSRADALRSLRERLRAEDPALEALSRQGPSLQPGDLDADRWWDQLTDEEVAEAYAERFGQSVVIDAGAGREGA